MKSKAFIQKRLACFLAAVLFLFTLPLSASATTTNNAVQSATTGVVQVRALYLDGNNKIWTGYTGTAFLINEEYLLTCDHVFELSADDLAAGQEAYGWTEKQIRDHSRVEIVVMRDVTIEASIVQESSIMDFAILKLSQKLYDRTYLPLRSSSEVQQTEPIYSLGFPGGVSYWQDTNTFTSDDVTITTGYVNKLNTVGTVNYIQHGAKITGGNSGGPLVDENGAVIGINVFTTGTEFETDYSYAVAIDQPKQVLDSLGIDYTLGSGGTTPQPESSSSSEPETTPPETTSPPSDDGDDKTGGDKTDLNAAIAAATLLDTSLYEADDSMTAFNSALSTAQRINDKVDATQEEIDSATKELTEAQGNLVQKPETGNMMLIIIAIVAAVVVAAVVIIIIVVSSNKKKKPVVPVPAPKPYPPVTPGNGGFSPVNPTPMNNIPGGGASSADTSVLGQGSNETTVLGQGSSETTVLKQNFGSLVRSKTGEKISINSDNFVIGRERARVNYCVSDNTSVGRTHARISHRGGTAYVADMQSRNGTYLNGVKLNPGQETALKNGDRFTVADEDFVYHA